MLIVDGVPFLTLYGYNQAAITIDLIAGAALYDFAAPHFSDEFATDFPL